MTALVWSFGIKNIRVLSCLTSSILCNASVEMQKKKCRLFSKHLYQKHNKMVVDKKSEQQ